MRNHHQNADLGDLGGDLRTKQSPWVIRELLELALLFVVVLGAWAWAMRADERDAENPVAEALADQQRAAMPEKVAEAYERGLTDAIEALNDTPNGVALAQACMARGAR